MTFTTDPQITTFEQNLEIHFGVNISEIVVREEDFDATSMTATVAGVPYDVYFNHRGEILKSYKAE